MSERSRPNRLAAYAAFGTLFVALLVAGLALLTWNGPGGQRSSGEALVGGPFSLRDQNGATVTDKDLLGKPSVIFFGFTNCPEICPTTLYELAGVLQALGSDGDKINTAFISLDPERDTPDVLKPYLASFDERILGLTGTPEDIAKVAKEYRVFYRKVPLDGGDYTMDHTALIYLFDGKGKFVAPLNIKQEPEKVAATIRAVM